MDSPLVYIVVLNWNNYSDTEKCVHSLLKVQYPNYKIVIVDNHSDDHSAALLKNAFPEIGIVETEYNGGYAFGMNRGARIALDNKAEFIVLLNNDTEAEPGFLTLLVDVAMSDSTIGIVSPKVLYMHDKNKIYCASGEFSKLLCTGKSKYRNKNSQNNGNKIQPISFAEGSCLLIKKDVFTTVGFIDEKYFMYFEDVDYSVKVSRHFRMMYTPFSRVYHKAGAGLSWANYSPLYYYYFTRNRILVYNNFSIPWRIYSILYSLLLCKVKSLVIIFSRIENGASMKSVRLHALWQGFIHGIIGKGGIKG